MARYIQNPSTYVQQFEIELDFMINPFYVDGELVNIEENIIPDLLADLNSLKFAYELEFRTNISDPSGNKAIYVTETLGSVGWFGENFNGFTNNYEVDSISYSDSLTLDSVSGLQAGRKTSVLDATSNCRSG